MAGNYPAINDSTQVLLFKAADNLYQRAVALGKTALHPPRTDDPIFSLQKKIVYLSALIAG